MGNMVMKENQCKHGLACKHRVKIGTMEICNYIGITGKPRGCLPGKCDKYAKRDSKRAQGHQFNRVEITVKG